MRDKDYLSLLHLHMSHTPNEQVTRNLQRDVDSAIDLLRILSKTKATHLVGKSQRLPVEELQLAAGLIFIFSTKVGLLASAVSGNGFLLKKVMLVSPANNAHVHG